MNLLERLKATLSPLAPGKAWIAFNDAQPPVLPYIVYTRVATDPNTNFDGANPLRYSRVQVDVYSRRALEAEAIGRLADAAMQAEPLGAAPLPGLGGPTYDDEAQVYRVSNDYGVWSTD